jgi:glycosyltransferase involved in cell wall biosynthesis
MQLPLGASPSMHRIVAIVPKLALTGGNLEVERLLRDLEELGTTVILLPVFPNKVNRFWGYFLAPYFYLRAAVSALLYQPNLLILTHYSTLPFGALQACLGMKVAVFIQAFEWLFPSSNIYIQRIMKAYHMAAYRQSQYLIFGNLYLKNNLPSITPGPLELTSHPGAILYPVGSTSRDLSNLPNQSFAAPVYEIGLILRNGWLKNQQAYYAVLAKLVSLGSVEPHRMSVINMLNSNTSSSKYSSIGVEVRAKMSHQDLCFWIANLKIFLCLSIHEGFGLPPLEAMALGAVPLVLSNGGCISYMSEFPELILHPNSSTQAIVEKISSILSWPDEYRLNKVDRLKASAQHYLDWASKARRAGAEAIFSLL